MAYFGRGRVTGRLHPSLRTFIDCFCSNPLPRTYPRGGGPHDQDPMLMRDFREILKVKGQCEEMDEAQSQFEDNGSPSAAGGVPDLESMLDKYIDDMDY